jgi:hypothetical protein
MMSDFRYEIKTSLPVIWLENIDFEKSGSVRTQRTHTTWFLLKRFRQVLVDPVDDLELV